jgi:hypothetical protein
MYIGSNARRHVSTPYDEGGLPRGEATFGMEHLWSRAGAKGRKCLQTTPGAKAARSHASSRLQLRPLAREPRWYGGGRRANGRYADLLIDDSTFGSVTIEQLLDADALPPQDSRGAPPTPALAATRRR